jgi:hypothetical protein
MALFLLKKDTLGECEATAETTGVGKRFLRKIIQPVVSGLWS